MTADLEPDLESIIRARDFSALRGKLENWKPADLSSLITNLPVEDQVIVFRILPRGLAARVFEYLDLAAQETLLKATAQDDVAALLNNMAPDDRTHLLDELPAAVTKQLLSLLTPEERLIAISLLGYPEDSIGRLMTPDYVSVRQDWTIEQVLAHIRSHGQDSETLSTIYVVDEGGVLIDSLRIRNILLASPATRVSDLIDHRVVALKASDDQEMAISIFKREDCTALPVTDTLGVLIGIVTVDDVLDVAESEATEDIQKIGGVEALETPFLQIPLARLIRKRANWLVILFFGELLTATAMGFFEKEIERAVVLALFVPLIISSGGNSGSQASTLVIRALALEEIRVRDWWRVMRREVLAGLALGSILGAIGFLRIALWAVFFNVYGEHWFWVALTVGLALIAIVLWGTLAGSMLPFVMRRLGFDPATSSTPFVATLVDVTGLLIYFSIAIVVLRGTLL
jgi:magnesium transporter